MKTRFIYLLITVFCCVFPFETYAVENDKEIDISTSPHKVFFEIRNAQPGDIYTKVLKVENNGTKDFKYLFSNRFLTGSEKVYNELQLTVSDNSRKLFEGNLRDFEKLDSRWLKNGTTEELTFIIYFPFELGNDFQSLSCEFQFKFYVEGTLGGVLPADGPKLPATGTNMFNALVVGTVLVLTGSILQFMLKRRSNLERQV